VSKDVYEQLVANRRSRGLAPAPRMTVLSPDFRGSPPSPSAPAGSDRRMLNETHALSISCPSNAGRSDKFGRRQCDGALARRSTIPDLA